MKLIDKDAVIAKILELKEKIPTSCTWGDMIEEGSRIGEDSAYCKLLSFIDTLEVKEVDLEKEINKEWEKCNPIDEGMGVESAYVHIEAFDMIAKHFFELGLRVNNEKEK